MLKAKLWAMTSRWMRHSASSFGPGVCRHALNVHLVFQQQAQEHVGPLAGKGQSLGQYSAVQGLPTLHQAPQVLLQYISHYSGIGCSICLLSSTVAVGASSHPERARNLAWLALCICCTETAHLPKLDTHQVIAVTHAASKVKDQVVKLPSRQLSATQVVWLRLTSQLGSRI